MRGMEADCVQADLTFMKAIKKRLNVREVKDDPEFARHDEGHEKYSRENLYLCVNPSPAHPESKLTSSTGT